jgi:hypothetical protein
VRTSGTRLDGARDGRKAHPRAIHPAFVADVGHHVRRAAAEDHAGRRRVAAGRTVGHVGDELIERGEDAPPAPGVRHHDQVEPMHDAARAERRARLDAAPIDARLQLISVGGQHGRARPAARPPLEPATHPPVVAQYRLVSRLSPSPRPRPPQSMRAAIAQRHVRFDHQRRTGLHVGGAPPRSPSTTGRAGSSASIFLRAGVRAAPRFSFARGCLNIRACSARGSSSA